MSSERQVPAEDASLIMPRHLGAGEEAKGPGGWSMTHQQDHPIPLSASSLPVTHCSGSLGKVSPKEQQQRPPYLPSVLGFPFPPWPLLFILCYFLRPAVLCLSRGILGSVGKGQYWAVSRRRTGFGFSLLCTQREDSYSMGLLIHSSNTYSAPFGSLWFAGCGVGRQAGCWCWWL